MLNSVDINRTLSVRYGVALGLIALLSTLGFLLLQYNLSAKAQHGALINVSGQQPMLSQKAALAAGEMYFGRTASERVRGEAMLRDTADRFRRNHEELAHGSARLTEPSALNETIRSAYFRDGGLDDMAGAYLVMIDQLLDPAVMPSVSRNLVDQLSDLAVTDLLTALEEAVDLYQDHVDENVSRVVEMHELVFAATLVLLVLEAMFIFRPLTRRLSGQADAISDMARDLANTARDLAATKDEMEGLVTAVAHDLRAPSNAIRGLADWLTADLHGRIDATSHALLVRLQERSHRFERLLGELLRFCRAADAEETVGELAVASLEEEVMADVFLPDGVEVAFEGSLPGTQVQTGPLVVVVRQLVTSALRRQDGDDGRIDVMFGLREGRGEGWGEDRSAVPGQSRTRGPRAVIAEIVDPTPAQGDGPALVSDASSLGYDLVHKIVTARNGALDVVEAGEDGTRLRLVWPLEAARRPDSRLRMVAALDRLDTAMLRAARELTAPGMAGVARQAAG